MKDICSFIDENKQYYIYGTTAFGMYCCDKITEKYGDDIIFGFIETVPKKVTAHKKNVFGLTEIDNDKSVIIAGFTSTEVMKNNLLEVGFSEENIIIPDGFKNYFIMNNNVTIEQVCFWPPINEYNKDLSDKIAWFLPDRISVKVWTDNKETIASFNENVQVCDINDADKIMDESDFICVWDMSKEGMIEERFNDKIVVVDPNFYISIDQQNYSKLYFNSFSLDEKNKFMEHSIEVYNEMSSVSQKYEKANVFCTGPSLQEIVPQKYSNDFNIICNSMVKDKELLNTLKPKMISFTDVAFYLSPNDYCQAFYKDLIETFEKYDMYIVVFEHELPLLVRHFPQLYDRLMGVRIDSRSLKVFFPNSDNLAVYNSSNIGTISLLLISSIFDVIGVAGCTGRESTETYFWKHNDKTQYIDLMHYVFEAYPAFFRDVYKDEYYEEHCKRLDNIIVYGESLGKKYINMTTSFIPALKERTEK